MRTFPRTLPRTLPRAAGVAVLALTLGLGLAACGDDDTEPTASDPNETTSSDPSTSTEAPTSDGTSTPSDPGTDPAGTVTVPVYFAGDTPMGPRLYREFREVESDNPAQEALALLVAGDALDPDYSSPAPSLQVSGVEIDDDEITVDVAAGTPSTGDKKADKLAVQAVVYTLQGIAQNRLPVEFDAEDDASVYGVADGTAVKAAPQLDVLSLVNLTTPEEGATVSGSFTAEGVSSSFEATVPWQLLDSSGAVVDENSFQAEGWFEKLYPFEGEIDVSGLEPGEYTFVVRTDDPSGGEGPGPFEDDRTITVE